MNANGRIDGVYTLKKNYSKIGMSIVYTLTMGDSYMCSEIIDGMVKIFVSKNSNFYMSVKEFYQYFYDIREIRSKKINSIMKKSGLCVKK